MDETQLKPVRKNISKYRQFLLDEIGNCEVCGFNFKPILQIHHKIPVCLGGQDTPENILLLCPNCHKTIHAIASKNFKEVPDEYVDHWMEENLTKIEKGNLFYYSLRATTGMEEEEFEKIVNFKSKRDS